MPTPITCRCACGAIVLEMDPPSRFVCHCHCHNCRRAHGAPFVTWAGFPDAAFRIVAGAEQLVHWTTDTSAVRSFCRTCGTTLLYRSPRWPGEVHVVVSNMEPGPDVPPKAHVYADRAPAWCPIADALPRYGGDSGTEPL